MAPLSQIVWYSRQDELNQYAIKAHSKMYIFDKEVAIIGGSNCIPTLETMNDDCDVLMRGPVALELSKIFQDRWTNRSLANPNSNPNPNPPNMPSQPHNDSTNGVDSKMDSTSNEHLAIAISTEKSINSDDEMRNKSSFSLCEIKAESMASLDRNHTLANIDLGEWDDDKSVPECVPSSPGSLGEDAIFRVALRMLRSAKRYIIAIRYYSTYINIQTTWLQYMILSLVYLCTFS
jgi:phosphatidylserine/phosphatidylglycerophosphate/cardiolipin synthase-like enzyme